MAKKLIITIMALNGRGGPITTLYVNLRGFIGLFVTPSGSVLTMRTYIFFIVDGYALDFILIAGVERRQPI